MLFASDSMSIFDGASLRRDTDRIDGLSSIKLARMANIETFDRIRCEKNRIIAEHLDTHVVCED